MQTNFSVYFATADERPRAVAHARFFSDAVALAETLAGNCHIVDAETDEILRIYINGEIAYTV